MRKPLVILAALAVFAVGAAAPAAGADGAGELNASFHAGLSGGSAIAMHSAVADAVASPQVNPEGRLEPFGAPEFVCDQLLVGTWVFILEPDPATLDAWTTEFKLDGEALDAVRTPNKRIAQGPFAGWWWVGQGIPVLGVLDRGLHDLEFSFDDGLGTTGTLSTPVDVDSAHC